jgi:hypothetical protein
MKKTGMSARGMLVGAVGLTGLAAAAVLYWFDPSQGGFYPICLFHRTTGLLCPGCGSLRAMHQLLHGHLARAFQLNPLLLLSIPLGIWFAARTFMQREDPAVSSRFPAGKWLWVVLGLGLAFSIWRNIPGTYFSKLP